jgi:hypothetical protein
MDEFFNELTKGGQTQSLALALRGRTVRVERAAAHAAVARFRFDELCGRPLGAEDYLGIASAFHTVFLEGVPQLTRNDINRVRTSREGRKGRSAPSDGNKDKSRPGGLSRTHRVSSPHSPFHARAPPATNRSVD